MPPSALRSSTVTSGIPSSPCSTLPALPPPGLKSRHTTPEIAPGAAGGARACTAPSGTSLGGIAVSPSSATPPGSTGRFSLIPVSALPVSAGLEGCASGSAPGGSKASATTLSDALTAPISGSFSYITRQITPAANSEIAIGMKTTVLNATDQRIRSSSTANIEPDRGHQRGHDRRATACCS